MSFNVGQIISFIAHHSSNGLLSASLVFHQKKPLLCVPPSTSSTSNSFCSPFTLRHHFPQLSPLLTHTSSVPSS